MPRLVNQKTLEDLFTELPNQFTLKELRHLCSKHKLLVPTVMRHGKSRKVFMNLEYGVYSRIRKIEPVKIPLVQIETVRHLGFIGQTHTPGTFPLPTLHITTYRMASILEATKALTTQPELQAQLGRLEDEVMQLRCDIADLLNASDPQTASTVSTVDVNHKPTTPKELVKLAEAYGWVFKRQSGGHSIYKHPGRPDPLSIPNANTSRSIGARASRLITTQIIRGTKGQSKK